MSIVNKVDQYQTITMYNTAQTICTYLTLLYADV